MPNVQIGDKWLLDRHIVFCGDTSSNKFINFLSSDAALAIVIPSSNWNHDYSTNKARIVAVVLEEDQIYNFCLHFCIHQKIPFRFQFLLGKLYVAVFSHQLISRPRKPEIEGIEGIVAYLVNQYTDWGNSVIAPFLGHGEILITCERMGRICVAGDSNPQIVSRALVRWQNWTQKQVRLARTYIQ
ncbi:MAG: hypothetical protein QNJ55_00480 [Xenococcus sp. MO_188.B8]|nr:hypothetical protein [Xenococcus sp. MO_188.B8]